MASAPLSALAIAHQSLSTGSCVCSAALSQAQISSALKSQMGIPNSTPFRYTRFGLRSASVTFDGNALLYSPLISSTKTCGSSPAPFNSSIAFCTRLETVNDLPDPVFPTMANGRENRSLYEARTALLG